MKSRIVLLIAMAIIAGSLGAPDDNGKGDDVTQVKTLDHARVAVIGAVLTDTPGLENWRRASINPSPLVLLDIHGKKLFYEYSVEKDGKTVGTIKTGANRALGHSVWTLEQGPIPYDPSKAIERADELAKKKYPGKKIISTDLVVYSYPKIGAMVTMTGNNMLIIDAADYSEIKSEDTFSFFDIFDEDEKTKRRSVWARDDQHVGFAKDKVKAKGIDLAKGLTESEFENLKKDMSIAGLYKTIYVPLYGQNNNVRCVVASAQMISARYGVYKTQNQIATKMGCGGTSGCYNWQALLYYQGTPPGGLGKYGSFADYSPTWNEVKLEIDAIRPTQSNIHPSSGSGHARVARGYKTDTDSWGSTRYWEYINDPWPVNVGKIYWEQWGSPYPGGTYRHTSDIRVK